MWAMDAAAAGGGEGPGGWSPTSEEEEVMLLLNGGGGPPSELERTAADIRVRGNGMPLSTKLSGVAHEW